MDFDMDQNSDAHLEEDNLEFLRGLGGRMEMTIKDHLWILKQPEIEIHDLQLK